MTMSETGSEAPGEEAHTAEPAVDPAAPPVPAPPGGAWPAAVDHKVVGKLFLAVAVAFLVAGGVIAMVMRAQLSAPDMEVVGGNTYRQLFTVHGVVMVFLFLLPAWIGLATAMVPLQIGAARLAFPRLQALALWFTVAGGAMVVAAPLTSDVISGWALSSPIPAGRDFTGDGPDLLILGVGLVLVAAVVASINLMVTTIKYRAPELTLRRLPMFSWSILVSSSVLLMAIPVIVAGLLILIVDRHYSGHVFNGFTGSRGGNPLLWPRLFWFGVYPMLWALLLPALGVVAEIVQVFGRHRLVARHRAMAAMAAIGVLSFAGWGSEVRSLARARPVFAIGALVVLAPVASVVMSWLATLAAARKEARRHPSGDESPAKPLANPAVLHAAGLVTVLGVGLAGAVVSAIDAGGRSHSNYWGVAHHHMLFFGASTVGLVAGLYFWAPKLFGRHLPAAAGRLQALALVGGLHLTFLPMYVLGIQDMGARTSSYATNDEWQAANLVASVGGAVLGLAVLMLVLNLLAGALRGRRAEADPWGGHTLEWVAASPPPPHNFDSLPDIRSEAPVLDLQMAASSAPVDDGEPPVPASVGAEARS